MGRIENMFKQIMEKNADSYAQFASHNTSIHNLEVQMEKISQALNSSPKGALPSDMMVNPKGGDNTGHAMAVIRRSERGRNAPTLSERQLVDDDQVVQKKEIPNIVVQANDEVRIDINDSFEKTQEEVNPSREHLIDISEPVVQKVREPLPKPPPPYPQRLAKQNGENKFKKFIQMMKSLSINVSLVAHQLSAIVHSITPKLDNSSAFTIPCTIGSAEFAKTLCDLGASINLIPCLIFKTLEIGQPRPSSMRLQTVDRTMERSLAVIEDVLIRIDKFILLVDFVILDCEVDYEVPIILGRLFLATGKAICDVEAGELTFRVGDKKVVFHVCKSMRQPNSNEVCSFVNLVTNVIVDNTSTTINIGDMLKAVLLNFDDDKMNGFMEWFQGMRSYNYAPRKLSLDLENKSTPPTNPSIEEPPTLELKPLLPHLRCEETNLMLNWEKCHFIVEEGIPLGHKISINGIEVDKAKIEVISKLPPPTLVKGVRSFLGHAGFYWHFIKDFSKVVNPLCKLLDKDDKFHFNDDCMRDFELLKLKLTTTLIITALNWSLPFEFMCDASDVAVRAVLGNIINSSQVNYTVTEKELIAIVFAIEKFCLYLMDRKGSESQVADHLSRLEEEGKPHDGLEINDSVPDDQLLAILMKEVPWVVRRCVPEEEQGDILSTCYSSSYGGHHGGARTTTKFLSCDFYWTTLYKDEAKSKWSGLFEIVGVTSFRALDLNNKNNEVFRVNDNLRAEVTRLDTARDLPFDMLLDPDQSAQDPSTQGAPTGQSKEPCLAADTADAVRVIFATPKYDDDDDDDIQLVELTRVDVVGTLRCPRMLREFLRPCSFHSYFVKRWG
ncbi:uncharacterized protein [Nicotiana tomentosiformis]|uniref:uncharacterized protein n=1 Tax=Nicotiana tomentosiformis TaxID=4098 RepID=UPI00388CD2BB